MKNYLSLVHKYLSAHKKKTRLTIISVAISVALITGVFSMLDVFLRFEKVQVIHDYGNYHLSIQNASEDEAAVIGSRIDVENAGKWIPMGTGTINGVTGNLGALDKNFAEDMNIKVITGEYPTKQNEIMLEQWVMEGLHLDLHGNDTVEISLTNGDKKKFVVSGIYNDLSHTKAKGVPAIFLSIAGAHEVMPEKKIFYLIKFNNGANIIEAEKEIKNTLHIADERIGRNDRLLAVIGQSRHKAATGFYRIGAILFGIVLIAGVVMMYNTFNISVMERVRQFGLLRCIGASRVQIKKLVGREGLYVILKAIPIGVVAGMLITFICSAILKFYNNTLFGEIPLFTVSISGIGAGIVIGFMTVFIACLLPAQKAAKVSPINAVTGSREIKIAKSGKRGLLTRMFPAEIAMGINNAVIKKKTLFLMSCSIAISIIMFLGFQVFVNFMYSSLKTTKPYTPDISLASEQGVSNDLYIRLLHLDGIKRVYGRMFGYVDATFDASRLTDTYKKIMPGIKVKDGLFVAPEKSWLISYDKNQFNWAKEDLIAGEISEDKINEQKGVIVVALNTRKDGQTETANLHLGDKVYVKTSAVTKSLTVLGILRSIPFSDSKLKLATFITTEKIFAELTGESAYQVIDIQLKSKNQEQTVNEIKGVADNNATTFLDARQKNTEIDQTFFTMAVFIYGFVAVIALISILNIINTMNTSVASKTRYLGVMRAVGMSGTQLHKMILVEAATYSLTGYVAGCVLGIILQKVLINNWLTYYHIVWKFPLFQIALILIIVMFATAFSVIGPLKRIKASGISEVVNAL